MRRCLAVLSWDRSAELAILRNGFSIRHERREVVGSVTRLYLGADREGYVDVPTIEIDSFEPDISAPAAPHTSQPINEAINTVSSRHHLDPDLINSVIHAESGFNPRAVSPKGAPGSYAIDAANRLPPGRGQRLRSR